MPLVILENAQLAFGHHALLDGAGLVIERGERIGLIGRNGEGKSSLIKVMAGLQKLDDGTLWKTPDLRIGYVPQEPELDPQDTIFEAVAGGLGDARSLLLDYHATSEALADPAADMDALLVHLQELQAALDAADGWRMSARIEAVLSRLSLPADRRVGELSGGWRKRVALARAWVADPELLLLDEPTNHLDIESIEWLENVLLEFSGAVLVISHDRRFLDRITTRMIELDRGRITAFEGNFSQYQIKKQELLEVEAVHNAKFDKVLAQEEAWIRQGIKARRTRNEGRVRRLEALRRERAERRNRMGQVSFSIEQAEKSGKLVAELKDVDFAYGDKVVARKVNLQIMRGDRIGFVGPNGVGKTTLLRLILGELQPHGGQIRQGTKLEVAYFDQLREQLDPEATLIDTISQGSEFIEINGEKKHVISYLGDFLFAPARARSPVKSLSGGERNRLLLARLMTRPANVLVLDEPTNDLDVETLELLEELLQAYAGTLFVVSHDRAFLDNVVTQIIAWEGEGRWKEYAGGYEDYLRARGPQGGDEKTTRPAKAARSEPAPAKKAAGLSYKEKLELESLPERLAALEGEQAALSAKMADPAFYQEPRESIAATQGRLEAIEEELLLLLERWEALEARS